MAVTLVHGQDPTTTWLVVLVDHNLWLVRDLFPSPVSAVTLDGREPPLVDITGQHLGVMALVE